MPAETVIAAPADLLLSSTEVAVSVTPAGVGTLAGAVYVVGVPFSVFAGETVPQVGEHAVPFCVSTHAAPWFVGSLFTEAVIGTAAFSGINAEAGATATVMARTVIPALPDFVLSAIEVAVMVTLVSLAGGVGGAVYVAVVLLSLLSVPAPDVGLIAHVTPWPDGSYCACPLRAEVPVASTEFGFAVTATEIAANVMFIWFDLVRSASEVAVIVTVTSLAGGASGAL